MNDTPKLTDQEVLEHARDVLAEHMPLQGGEEVCTGADLLQILLGVSAKKGQSIRCVRVWRMRRVMQRCAII